MFDKFYIQKLLREDGATLAFDGREIYLAEDNDLLVRPEIQSSEVEYTDIDGGEMIYQRLGMQEQPIKGLIFPRTSGYWDLYFKLGNFFQKNYSYTIIYKRKDGQLFAQRNAWLSRNLQVAPQPQEDSSPWSVALKMKNAFLYEYSEDSSGKETYANIVTLPRISASPGGEKWDKIGAVYDNIGEVWESGSGGLQTININSTVTIYPLWIVTGDIVNPYLQNNTTDMIARYNGTIAKGQTLIVNMATGEARLDGALVSKNISGQVNFSPGQNVVGFDGDSGSATNSQIKWNNIIG